MAKSLVIAEEANLAALVDKGKAIEFFFQNSGFSVGDIYTARVENILPSIDAVFVSLGTEKMGFLHASDIPGHGPLSERIWPKQKLLVQVVKEPTSNKGPRVSTDITLIGRFFVLTTENNNIVMSRRISSANERARLKSIATLLKPPLGFGLVVRTEAMGASDRELEEDFRELFLERWKYVIDQFEAQRRPSLIIADSKDLLYRVLRDVFHDGVDSVAVDNPKAAERAKYYLELWSHRPPVVDVLPVKKLLKDYGVLDELKMALSSKIELPSGGYMHIQPTEALTVIDVNSGKFTSSRTPAETVLKTNIEAATEIARQLRLRNIGGVIVIDFIDMETKFDRLAVLEHFEKLLETDPAHPQIGRLSDLGLVELTRHRQEKSLFESLGEQCSHCQGGGWVFPIFKLFEENSNAPEEIPNWENYQEENVSGSEVIEHRPRWQNAQTKQIEQSAMPKQAERRKPHHAGTRFNEQNQNSAPENQIKPQRPAFPRKDKIQNRFGPQSLEDELLMPNAEFIQLTEEKIYKLNENNHQNENTNDHENLDNIHLEPQTTYQQSEELSEMIIPEPEEVNISKIIEKPSKKDLSQIIENKSVQLEKENKLENKAEIQNKKVLQRNGNSFTLYLFN